MTFDCQYCQVNPIDVRYQQRIRNTSIIKLMFRELIYAIANKQQICVFY